MTVFPVSLSSGPVLTETRGKEIWEIQITLFLQILENRTYVCVNSRLPNIESCSRQACLALHRSRWTAEAPGPGGLLPSSLHFKKS